MQLLVVTQYFWPENFKVNDLVAELVRRGHQVTVLTGLPNYPDGAVFRQYNAAPEQYSLYDGAQVVRVPIFPRGKGSLRLILNYLAFALSASILGPWKLRGKRFDAIFVYEPSPITVGIPSSVLRWIKGAPVVFWVQDLWPETLQAIGVIRSPLLLHAVGKLVSFIYKRCDLILSQSRSFIPQIQKYAVPQSRIVYFPGWSESIFDLAKVDGAPEVPLNENAFNVMFAGNIGEAQDFHAILAAAERVKDEPRIRWLIVGDGRMADWVKQEIRRRHLGDNVLMLGRYPLERMPSFFKHADALLVSLKDEPIFSMTIPSKLQSYLASGIPVVAMMNGEGADVVVRSGAGLACQAGDDAGLASAVVTLSNMTEQERAFIGSKGLEISKLEFNREALISQLECFFMELTETNVSSTALGNNS